MPINIFLHKNYTLNSSTYQLKLPLNVETIIPADDSVWLLSQFVEGMDLTDLYSTYERIRETDFSQKNDTIDLLAPGENLQVATRKGNSISVFGTSYSAAYVCGRAAKLWSETSELTAQELKDKIFDMSQKLEGSQEIGCGVGILNNN